MTLDQFRTKWGGVFGSLLVCELINRVDANVNTPLVAAGKELADDLQKLLATTSTAPAEEARGQTVVSRLSPQLSRLGVTDLSER